MTRELVTLDQIAPETIMTAACDVDGLIESSPDTVWRAIEGCVRRLKGQYPDLGSDEKDLPLVLARGITIGLNMPRQSPNGSATRQPLDAKALNALSAARAINRLTDDDLQAPDDWLPILRDLAERFWNGANSDDVETFMCGLSAGVAIVLEACSQQREANERMDETEERPPVDIGKLGGADLARTLIAIDPERMSLPKEDEMWPLVETFVDRHFGAGAQQDGDVGFWTSLMAKGLRVGMEMCAQTAHA
ncbi:MAG: hypothetical protein ACOY58_05925 [Candidatus Micrarchaeota archaeon]